ncbi:unnamed protein product [Rodentolepis nana]|uniref:Chromate transporter n=1 Tax=Rodentolepis nana TaxID=102285 RepID=A0A0R3TZU8_RODNA|nr:unnamed protein product [Rodentolepis nana]
MGARGFSLGGPLFGALSGSPTSVVQLLLHCIA